MANAVVHTPPETEVSIVAQATPGALRLEVTDNGPGVPPDALPTIFEKFVKLSPSGAADGGEGTGLGLAIAKGIMDAHGGSISAESPVAHGRGARFTLSFPREAAP